MPMRSRAMGAFAILAASLVALVSSGCGGRPQAAQGAAYLASPEESVPVLTKLLKDENWETLATYYDLSGTAIDAKDLRSGKFFLRGEKSPMTQPASVARYRTPFAPGSKFSHTEKTSDPAVTRVVVVLSIDQGGGMVQRMLSNYLLRKEAKGYRIVPDPEDVHRAEMLKGYEPKKSPDTALDFRPALAGKMKDIPPAELASLVPLLNKLKDFKRKLSIMPIPPPKMVDIPWAGVESYSALDEELIASEIGDRIRRVVERNEPAKVFAQLKAANVTEFEVKYNRIAIHHTDVMGSGRVFYADRPEPVKFMLPKPDTGF